MSDFLVHHGDGEVLEVDDQTLLDLDDALLEDLVGLVLGDVGVPVAIVDAGCEDGTIAMTGIIHGHRIGQVVNEVELGTSDGIVAGW